MDEKKLYGEAHDGNSVPEAPKDWFNTTAAFDSVPDGIEPPSAAAEALEKALEAPALPEEPAKAAKLFARAAAWVKGHRKAALIGGAAAAVLLVGGVALALLLGGGVGDSVTEEPYTDTFADVDVDEYAGVLLEKTERAGNSYLEDTLFIGDSNTARIELYGFLTLDNVIGIESMGIQQVTTAKCVYFKDMDGPVTIPEAVKLMQPRRIIINFGTNNIISNDVDTFISEYSKTLDAIKKAYPYADIIVGAIPPLGSNRTNKLLTMDIVDEYNRELLDLVKEKGYTFLNITETLKGSDGYMKSDYIISDGIHISKKGFEAIFNYIRTHAHIVEDGRPKPLNKIPERAYAPVVDTGDKEFNAEKMIDAASNLLVQAGHSAATASDDMTKAVSVTYAVPEETKPGTENTVAQNFASFIEAQVSWKTFHYQLSYKYNKDTGEYVFTALVVNAVTPCEEHVGEWTVTKEVTCTTDGRKQRTCTECGTIETETVAATGHTLEGSITVVTAASCHTEGSGTQLCSVCEQTVTVPIEKTEHAWGEWNVTTAATCTTAGSRTRSCTATGCTAVQTEEVAKAEHTWGDWTVTQAATCAAAGSRNHTCSVCGTSATEEIPKSGTHSGLQGDGSCTVCGKPADPVPEPAPTTDPVSEGGEE